MNRADWLKVRDRVREAIVHEAHLWIPQDVIDTNDEFWTSLANAATVQGLEREYDLE